MIKKIIEVNNLVKRYKKATFNAVDNITFDVKEGEFFTFLGPNGAGKTTTISILTTTLSKTSGLVKIAGYDIDKNSNKVRQNVGIIFQNPSLDLNLTAEENIRFHAVLYGLYNFAPTFSLMPNDYKKRVKNLAEVLGIQNDLNKPIKTFSGGMKRKLEIIRSLMHKPKILFLDEPTIGLDPLSRKTLWEYLKQVRAEQKTTIFLTTHYLDEAENADRVCIVNRGKIVQIGTPNQIKKNLIDEYLLVDAKNKKQLENELKQQKIDFNIDGLFKIHLKNESSAQQIIKSLKTPLTVLKTHSPTLEEAYLEIIGQKNKIDEEKSNNL